MRLRRSDCSAPGIVRRRHGKGFSYRTADDERVTDPEMLERIRSLAIPPAWQDVWICPWKNGHIQATGVDDAGRTQYLYHESWTERQAHRKFDRILEFSRKLPELRKQAESDLEASKPTRDRGLALAVRLLDRGFFRIGSERYAEENDTYGLATIPRSQVRLEGRDGLRFEYMAKGSQERIELVEDPVARRAAEPLIRRRTGPDQFLAWRDRREWLPLGSDDVNGYIHRWAGEEHSAKDFRTWSGTVATATSLAAGEIPDSKRARERVIRVAIEATAELLGNTPAVSRDSYIDPRVLDRYRGGHRIRLPRNGDTEEARKVIEKRVRALIEDGR